MPRNNFVLPRYGRDQKSVRFTRRRLKGHQLTQRVEAAKLSIEVLMMTISELEKRMLALSVDERARLALALLHSLESQDADAHENWESVISERAAAYRNGNSKTEAAEHVLARLRERR